MSIFTMTLAELKEYEPTLGLEKYPIASAEHRAVLNDKIFRHYNAREIGYESGTQFIYALERRMAEIMPLYNQLYKSELLVLTPLLNMRVTNTDNGSSNVTETTAGNSSSITANDAKGKQVAYEMPQVALAGSNDYATSAGDSDSVANSTGSGTSAGNSATAASNVNTSVSEGFQGSQAELLRLYRESFLNIDMLVIESLGDLFMSVWDSGSSMTENPYGPYGYSGLI